MEQIINTLICKILSTFLFVACSFAAAASRGAPSFDNGVQQLAKEHNCHLDDNHFEKNEKGTKPPYEILHKSGSDVKSAVFWCQFQSGGKERSKIVIHLADNESRSKYETLTHCPSEIIDVQGHSTGIWVENGVIYTGFEDGFYYMCRNKKWHRAVWH